MAVQKEQAKIPLCEYDPSQESVLMPNHEKLGITLPPVAVFAFLEDFIDEYAKQNHLPVLAQFVSATKTYPVYGLNLNGKAICLCQAPVGAPAAVQIMDWLIAYGVKHVISAGSCGALVDLPENCFLVPAKALRDEGTSYHYLPPERFVETDEETRRMIERCFRKKGLAYEECVTWTTDGFFRETKDKVLARRQEGCTVVEMECAALAACAQFRGVKFGQFFFTADCLAQVEAYDERTWGDESWEPALMLALDIAAAIPDASQTACFDSNILA